MGSDVGRPRLRPARTLRCALAVIHIGGVVHNRQRAAPVVVRRRHGRAVDPALSIPLHRYAGVFATADALAAGIDRNSIGPRLRTGEWHRLRYGVYTTGATWRAHEATGSTHRLECAAVLRRLGRETAVISGTSAARLHGLIVPRTAPEVVALTDPDQFRTGRAYAVSQAMLPAVDVVDIGGLPTTSLARTLADVGREWELADTVVAMDDALSDGRLTLDDLRAATLAQTHWRNCGRAARAVSLSRVGAHSAHETLSRLGLVAAGLPEPLLQQAVYVGTRLVAVLDMLLEGQRVFAECDGFVKLAEPWGDQTPAQKLWAEKQRQDTLLDLDLLGVRIIPADVRSGLAAKAHRLQHLLDRGCLSPPRYRTELFNQGLRTTPRHVAA